MKISLVGYGHLGKWHAEKLEKLYRENFTAIVELDERKHQEIIEKFPRVKVTKHLEEIIDQVDAVVIATPTTFHFEIIKTVIGYDKHCFVEKPMTSNLQESLELDKYLRNNSKIFQVGHSERFHGFWPSLIEKESFSKIKIARFDRIAPYKGRGDDVDIIYDLMIHDYDLLTMFGFEAPQEIQAWGASCHTEKIDYCTSKITYQDKVVFVTASRSNILEKRTAEFVFNDGVLEIDFISGEVRRSYKDKETTLEKFEKRDHLLEEHKLFQQSILSKTDNDIGYEVGHHAMKLMDLTVKSIEEKKTLSWNY